MKLFTCCHCTLLQQVCWSIGQHMMGCTNTVIGNTLKIWETRILELTRKNTGELILLLSMENWAGCSLRAVFFPHLLIVAWHSPGFQQLLWGSARRKCNWTFELWKMPVLCVNTLSWEHRKMYWMCRCWIVSTADLFLNVLSEGPEGHLLSGHCWLCKGDLLFGHCWLCKCC